MAALWGKRYAKLTRPRLFEALPRERLFACLDRARERSIVWLVGPPGAGKTTLVASYLEIRKLTGIWYQLDSGDADPATFFYYLRLAERALPRRQKSNGPLPLFTPEFLPDVAGFSRRLFRELFFRLRSSGTLVIDNFQDVAEVSLLHEGLASGLEELPEGVRVFIISRIEPGERYVRFSANRKMEILDWEQLKLTADEAKSIVQSAGVSDRSGVDTVVERAGGWAAGLILLIEKLRRGGRIDSMGEPDSLQEVFAYFAGQLFDRAAAADRTSLLKLGYLPTVTEGMAEQLTGDTNAKRMLEQLYRRHLFTHRRQGDEVAYQFHALFRAFLQHRAESDLTPTERTDTQRRAAALLELSGQSEEAMHLYIKAGDFASAESLILGKAASLIAQGRWKVVVDWVGSLPEVRKDSNCWLLHWLGTAQIGVDPPGARAILEKAHSMAVQANDAVCQVLAAAGMVEAIFLEYSVFTPLNRWIEVLEQMMQEEFAFRSLETELRAQSALLVALTYRMPDHPRIDHCVSRVKELLQTGIDANLRVAAATHLTLYGSFTGHLEESRRACAILVPLLSDPDVHVFRRIFAWAVITWYACNSGEHELGARAVTANETIAAKEGIHIAERFGCIIGYFLDMDRGDAKAGWRRIERFETIMIATQPYEAASLVNMKAWHGVYTAQCTATLRHGPIAVGLYQEAGSIPHILVGLNGLIWGCVEGRDFAQAKRWITEHRRWSSKRNMEWAQWSPDAAEAIMALGVSDEAMLEDRLHRIFSRERHRLDQYGHMLAWCRGWSSVLCGEALRRGIEPDRVRRFVFEFSIPPPSSLMKEWPWRLQVITLGRFQLLLDGEQLVFTGKVPNETRING